MFNKVSSDSIKEVQFIYPQNELTQLFHKIPNREIRNFKNIDFIKVKGSELMVYLIEGIYKATLTSGTYAFDREKRNPNVEIIWLNRNLANQEWGVGYSEQNPITTKDGIIIGLNGTLSYQIIDEKSMVQFLTSFNIESELVIRNVIRYLVGSCLSLEIQYSDLEELGDTEDLTYINNQVRSCMGKLLQKIGIEVSGFEILGSVMSPDEDQVFNEVQRQDFIIYNRLELRDYNRFNDFKPLKDKEGQPEISLDNLMAFFKLSKNESSTDESSESENPSLLEKSHAYVDDKEEIISKEEEKISQVQPREFDDISVTEKVKSEDEKDKQDILPKEVRSDIVQKKRRHAAIDYYDRMIPSKHYELLVEISTQSLDEKRKKVKIMTGERKIRVHGSLDITDDVKLIKIIPLFPGCLVTPNELEMDLSVESQKFTFFIAPLVHGKISKADIQFWNYSTLIASISTPTKVINPWTSRMIAIGGVVGSTLPKLTAMGLNLQSIPSIALFNNQVDLLVFLIIPGSLLSLTLAGLYRYFTRPRKSTTSGNIEGVVIS